MGDTRRDKEGERYGGIQREETRRDKEGGHKEGY